MFGSLQGKEMCDEDISLLVYAGGQVYLPVFSRWFWRACPGCTRQGHLIV
jgi:hypothetical protein